MNILKKAFRAAVALFWIGVGWVVVGVAAHLIWRCLSFGWLLS